VSARIDPDTRPVLVVATTSAVLLAAVSFALSFAGLVQLAAWGHVPGRLAWCVPVMIDGAIAVYTLAVLVARARGERQWTAWAALTLWTAVSVGGNAAHGWAPDDAVQRLVGTLVVALAPVAVLLATHTIADLIVARPAERTPTPNAPDVVGVTFEPSAFDRVRAARTVEHITHTRRPVKRTPPDVVARARAMRSDGKSVRAVASALGIAPSTVHAYTRQEPAA
jgi:hypothetical protein